MRSIVEDVKKYYLLKIQQEILTKRLKQLRDRIIAAQPVVPGYIVDIQYRRRQKIDDLALENLLVSKGLWDECKKEVPDHSLVEQAYIEGKLTDNDMRTIDGGRDLIPALHVERVEEDVQANYESDSEQSGD